MASSSLGARLSGALPKSARLTIHHCAALPISTEPLFVSAPDTTAEATELESHFLSVSVQSPSGLVQAFAIEVLAYTTTTLTTLFVSKADSTGYLHLLGLPPGTPSPIRAVLVEFLIFLVEAKKRADSRLVLSLFARAQDQYLFPGSVENAGKHVLDDRGLVKWWVRILDEIFRAYGLDANRDGDAATVGDFHVRGHLVVPGIDQHETRSFIPRDADYKTSRFWQVTDPLKSLGMPKDVPERCLIPRFPDDPKARYAIELDDELAPEAPKIDVESSGSVVPASGRWRSVRNLETFWDFMSYRQECSAGRLTGFLWGIWEPEALVGKPFQAMVDGMDRLAEAEKVGQMQDGGHTLLTPTSTQIPTQDAPLSVVPDSATSNASLVVPLGIATPASSQSTSPASLPVPPESPTPAPSQNLPSAPATSQTSPSDLPTPASTQPAPSVQTPSQTRPSINSDTVPPPIEAVKPQAIPPLVKPVPAEIMLTADAYARSMELLLTLDYCDLATAVDSTQKFLNAISEEGGKEKWGVEVQGQKETRESKPEKAAGEANSLAGSVRKRPKAEATTLSAGLVRKKPKT